MERTVLALDGHDGSGKTTLAARLAGALGGVHVRPYAGPTGQIFMSAVERGDFAAADEVARRAVADSLKQADASILVFDRHWMTAFSVLPEVYWRAWPPLPPTLLCWADLETTRARIGLRAKSEADAFDHQRFLSIYRGLAERFGCELVRTDQLNIEESCAAALAWARRKKQ